MTDRDPPLKNEYAVALRSPSTTSPGQVTMLYHRINPHFGDRALCIISIQLNMKTLTTETPPSDEICRNCTRVLPMWTRGGVGEIPDGKEG